MTLDILESQLKISDEQVRLFETIHKRPDKRATNKEIDKLKGSSPLNAGVMTLILEAKSRNREKRGQKYQPFLLNTEGLLPMALEFHIKQMMLAKTPFHYDCILQYGRHCSPLQLDFDGDQFQIFYIEGSLDNRNEPAVHMLSQHANVVGLYSTDKIQADLCNCGIFSLQQLNKLPDKQSIMSAMEQNSTLELHAAFIKNAQKSQTIEEYLQKHSMAYVDKHQRTTLQNHMDRYSITYEGIDDVTGIKTVKTLNYAIQHKRNKYLRMAYDLAKQLTRDEVQSIMEQRTQFINMDTGKIESSEEVIAKMCAYYIEHRDIQSLQKMIDVALDYRYPQPNIIMLLINQGATHDLLNDAGLMEERLIHFSDFTRDKILLNAFRDLENQSNDTFFKPF